MSQHVSGNIFRNTYEHKWSGGKIIVSEYVQKFKETEVIWYKYTVKRTNGTIVEESKRVSVSAEVILLRIAYFQSITEEEAKDMRECDERYGKRKGYLANTNEAWAVN